MALPTLRRLHLPTVAPITSSNALAGSGTAADSDSAEGIAEPQLTVSAEGFEDQVYRRVVANAALQPVGPAADAAALSGPENA